MGMKIHDRHTGGRLSRTTATGNWRVAIPVAAAAPARQRAREAVVASQRAAKTLAKTDRKARRDWYTEELQPRLSRMDPSEIERGAAVRRSYAYYIVAGTRVPHPRHYPNLAALVGVALPRAFTAAET